jgi:glycosyltransferase involved in cell wall biosynthesis
MPSDLAVISQDPRFGGGGLAQTDAFMTAARDLGRDPSLLVDPHPGLGRSRTTWRRVEALRQLASARTLEADAAAARSLWVVATLAHNGGAAPRSGRRYGCWIGTTIDAEWKGRASGLSRSRRIAAGASIGSLRAIERRVLRNAQRLYATSAASRAQVAAGADLSEDEVGLLPIPIQLERFQPATDDEWRHALERPVLTFVGRADDPRKNIGLLLDAFTEVRETHPDARLRLVGTAPAVAVPDGVEVVGPVGDVAAELRRAAIFVLPSSQEGFGIVVAEALAGGLPVITTPCGGPEELVHASGGGRVLETFEAEELARAIASLAETTEAATAMRTSGQSYVHRVHDPNRFRELLDAALKELDGD